MDEKVRSLTNALGGLAPAGQQEIDPQDRILDVKLTIREATLILNKLNTANFVGFNESGLAMQIFAKISAASRVEDATSVVKPAPQQPGTPFAKPAPVTKPPTPEKDEVNTAAPMSPVTEARQPDAPAPKTDDAPPEDAGVFSVIDKSGDI